MPAWRTARDLAIVALMLLNGLRSREVLALKLGDLLFSEALIRVHGKGARIRMLPLPPETRVYAGHGPRTTIGHEQETNPYLYTI